MSAAQKKRTKIMAEEAKLAKAPRPAVHAAKKGKIAKFKKPY